MVMELIIGRYPYPSTHNIIEMVENLQHLPPPSLPSNGLYSPEIIHFISCCLQKEPENRANVDQLLGHPFILKHWNSQVDLAGWLQQIL